MDGKIRPLKGLGSGKTSRECQAITLSSCDKTKVYTSEGCSKQLVYVLVNSNVTLAVRRSKEGSSLSSKALVSDSNMRTAAASGTSKACSSKGNAWSPLPVRKNSILHRPALCVCCVTTVRQCMHTAPSRLQSRPAALVLLVGEARNGLCVRCWLLFIP